MEKGFEIIIYGIKKIFNILIGIPLVFAITIIVLSICLVDLILLLLPVFWICNIFLKDQLMIVVPTGLGLQFVFTIVGTLMGCYLYKLLKVYVPKWFKFLELYGKKLSTFVIENC